MNEITIVSIGPGARELMTLGALKAMQEAERLVLRTEKSDAAAYLREIGVHFETLDSLYEKSEDFEELTRRSVKKLMRLAGEGPLCYGVFDAAADETVKALRAENVSLRVLPGVPLASPVMTAAAKQEAPLEIQTASSLQVTNTQNDLLILELNSRMLAGSCKLQLLKWYDPDQPIRFFDPSESPERACRCLTLSELDRQAKYDHTAAVLIPAEGLMERRRFDFYDLVRVMALLRGENGCPWDKEQTHQSLKKYLVEEAYETAAAIDEEDWDHVADELGDVLLQVVFHANVGEQYGTLELSDITSHVCEKMISRHRHIFGSDHCETAEDVSKNWEKIKKEQRGFTTQTEVLQDVSKGLPPIMRASKVQKKAREVGFDWDDPRDALKKVHEEADEVLAELDGGRDPMEELGDLFFACVNVARLAHVDGAAALQAATEKFIRRFAKMENAILQDGKRLEALTLSEMDVYWESIKHRP